MKFHVLTLFPEHIDQGLNTSIIKRARQKQLIDIHCINIRDFAGNKHFTVDDYPYGGGAGMVMQAGPVVRAYESLGLKENQKVIFLSPQGRQLNQAKVVELAQEQELVLLCGHYEGIDQRAIDQIVTEEISIGDYVLTGGELAAMVLIDAVSRHIDGVLSNADSAAQESFENHLLEHAQYTRPFEFRGQKVPEVLISGNHQKITQYRKQQSIEITKAKRPDLYQAYRKANPSEKE